MRLGSGPGDARRTAAQRQSDGCTRCRHRRQTSRRPCLVCRGTRAGLRPRGRSIELEVVHLNAVSSDHRRPPRRPASRRPAWNAPAVMACAAASPGTDAGGRLPPRRLGRRSFATASASTASCRSPRRRPRRQRQPCEGPMLLVPFAGSRRRQLHRFRSVVLVMRYMQAIPLVSSKHVVVSVELSLQLPEEAASKKPG